ncbi:MAG: phosphatidate cytidylyltransferase [Mycoplasmataceae bacterium]|nr:phosphatidate cytidylyltransferase [Mycoplasmataceae bacterium]
MLFSNKSKWGRYISIAIMLSFALPGVLITAYAGEVGKYIGSALFMVVGILAIFEVIQSLGFNKYVSLISAFLIVPFFLLSFSDYKWLATHDTSSGKYSYIIHDKAIDWKGYIIVSLGALFPIIIQPNVAKEKMGIISTSIALIFVMVVASTFTKVLWVLNTMRIEPVLFFIFIAVISDTFAYFGGMLFGKKWFKGKKLAPNISPNKTWAGAVTGFVFTLIFTIVGGYYLNIWVPFINGSVNVLLISILMGILLSVVAPLGDLAFSSIKRKSGVKDFSNLFPGHGGIFDRIDAMSVILFVATIVYLAIY